MTDRPRTQIFMASTLYGAATLAAALDADCFAPADRRILLISNNTAIPETGATLDSMPGFERLRGRFTGSCRGTTRSAPSTPAAGPPGPTTSPCGSATCGCCGASATTMSS